LLVSAKRTELWRQKKKDNGEKRGPLWVSNKAALENQRNLGTDKKKTGKSAERKKVSEERASWSSKEKFVLRKINGGGVKETTPLSLLEKLHKERIMGKPERGKGSNLITDNKFEGAEKQRGKYWVNQPFVVKGEGGFPKRRIRGNSGKVELKKRAN